MKKMIVIIVILLIIFISMVMNKYGKKQNNITIQEVEKIEKYISQIYMWEEVTKEALPEFENINEAEEQWLWEVVKRDLEEYELDYETIENRAKELYGENFEKELPKEGNSSYEYNEEAGKYLATEINLDAQNDSFLLLDIQKNKDEYIVEIAEYIVDYSEEDNIEVENLEGEVIQKLSTKKYQNEDESEDKSDINNAEEELKIKEIVKQNITRFSKKKIYLKQGENLEVRKVEKC